MPVTTAPRLDREAGARPEVRRGKHILVVEDNPDARETLVMILELAGHRGDEKFKLSDLRGKKNAVIVFYPLDWTPV